MAPVCFTHSHQGKHMCRRANIFKEILHCKCYWSPKPTIHRFLFCIKRYLDVVKKNDWLISKCLVKMLSWQLLHVKKKRKLKHCKVKKVHLFLSAFFYNCVVTQPAHDVVIMSCQNFITTSHQSIIIRCLFFLSSASA